MRSSKSILAGLTLLCLNMVILSSGYSQAKISNKASGSDKKYDVAAIIWPSYHPDVRAKIFWPDGIGEWQTVMSNKPKFEGHEQPRYPLWGYVNEAEGSEGQGGYAGSKAALRGLLGTLAKEWKATDEHQAVRVGLIEPDYLEKTAITVEEQYWLDLARARRTTVNKISDDVVARTKVPLRREARLTEISEVVLMYAVSTYLNGEAIPVSGGKTIRL